jgi:hypothetical protein
MDTRGINGDLFGTQSINQYPSNGYPLVKFRATMRLLVALDQQSAQDAGTQQSHPNRRLGRKSRCDRKVYVFCRHSQSIQNTLLISTLGPSSGIACQSHLRKGLIWRVTVDPSKWND